jgi:hypothetical protein
MNNVAISPKIGMYALQNQNVERKIAKPIDIHKMTSYITEEELAKETENETV